MLGNASSIQQKYVFVMPRKAQIREICEIRERIKRIVEIR